MHWKQIIEKYKPTKADEKAVKSLMKQVVSKIKLKDTKVIVGGSGGKNTWLKGTHDIDIYVKFNYAKYKEKSDKLADLLQKALQKQLKVTRLHGSRDYFQIRKSNFTFEIVPILDIKNYKQARNTTDLSQLHVNYVKKYPKLTDEIRLAKIFAKANKVYGAESYIRGFSGYCLEVLVIHYKSFKRLMTAAAKWKAFQVIGSKKLATQLNAAKKVSPLILIDPVQPIRNVAAALSKEKYNAFIKAAKAFVKNPSLKAFTEKKLDLKQLAKKGKLLFIEIIPLKGKKDIVGAKVLKAFAFIKKQIQNQGFKLHTAGWHFDETTSYAYFVVDPKPLSKDVKHYGPPRTAPKALKIFKKKYKTIAFEGEKSYTKKPRPFTTIEPFLEQLLQQENVKKRVHASKLQAIIEAKKL